jgi:hypothetical protein
MSPSKETDIQRELDGVLKQTAGLPEIVRRRIAYTVKEARDQRVSISEVKLDRSAQTPVGDVEALVRYWASRLMGTLERASGVPLLREELEERMRDSCQTGSVPRPRALGGGSRRTY